MPVRSWIFTVTAAALAIATAGCGSSKDSTTTTTSSTTSTHATGPAPLSVTVRHAGPGSTFGANATAAPGQPVAIQTIVPGTRTTPPQQVQLTLAQANQAITVTAHAGSQSSTAMIHTGPGATGLGSVHFSCQLPPAPTYCPLRGVTRTPSGYQLNVFAAHSTPIELTGLVNPAKGQRTARAPGTLVVPPYKVSVQVQARAPGGKAPTGSTASAHPGNIVAIITRVSGSLNGAPQKVTVTFDQGPAPTLAVSASVNGGSVAHATITAAGGSKIAIVLPQYTCFLPPAPTFCPAKSIQASGHRYQLTFMASPATPPIVVKSTVQSG